MTGADRLLQREQVYMEVSVFVISTQEHGELLITNNNTSGLSESAAPDQRCQSAPCDADGSIR